jgi:hypothetical protein
MENEAEAIGFLQYKQGEIEKVTKRHEEQISYLKRKIKENFERNMKVAKEKLKVGREKEKKRWDILGVIQKENRDQQTRLRTEKRIAELRLEQMKEEDQETEQLPH